MTGQRYRRSTAALAWTMVFSFAGLAVAAVGVSFALASLLTRAR